MRPSFKDYFYFNKIERRGVLILLTLIFLVILANQLLVYFPVKENKEYSENELLALLTQLEKEDSALLYDSLYKKENIDKNEITNENYFPFDPNKTSIAQWIKLGLSKKQAEVIKNYQAKGGVFRIKYDVAKMYVISNEHYKKLAPYILLPEKLSKEVKKGKDFSKTKYTYKEWEPAVVDINIADSTDLLKIYGIGPYYAGKIIDYRNRLGGYSNKQQLLEIWHFSDSMFTALDSSLIITKVELRKLNVNLATVQELQYHPYINWNIANSIVNLRKQHGKFNSIEEIRRSVLINDSTYAKISPYLTAE